MGVGLAAKLLHTADDFPLRRPLSHPCSTPCSSHRRGVLRLTSMGGAAPVPKLRHEFPLSRYGQAAC